MNEDARRAIYALVPTLQALLVAYGILTHELATVWGQLALSLLACVVAFVHVRPTPQVITPVQPVVVAQDQDPDAATAEAVEAVTDQSAD